MVLRWALVVVVSYLLGSILTGDIVARFVVHADVRQTGTGNPGTANMTSQFGIGPGILTLAGDVLKTCAAVWLAWLWLPGVAFPTVAMVAGTVATVGHIFPVWAGFKGGKGVACMIATIVLARPLVALVALVVGLVFLLATRYLCIAGVAIPLAFLCGVLVTGCETAVWVFALVQLGLAVYAHGPFLAHIKDGTVPRTDLIGKFTKRL